MQFGILGPLRATDGDNAVGIGRPKQRALLARLLLHPNQIVSAERLAEDLFEEDGPANPAATLQVHVSRLRKALTRDGASPIVSRPPGYCVEVATPDDLDAWRFARLVGEAQTALTAGEAERASDLLTAALALWRGPALIDVAFASFAQAEILRLEAMRLGAVEELLEAKLALGRHREAVPELEALAAEHPLRERPWGQLMRALYLSGRQADALRAYRRFSEHLATEVGLVPGPSLQSLEGAILRHELEPEVAAPPRPVAVAAAPAEPTEFRPRHNLPLALTTFVGRQRECQDLEEALGHARLVTLTGVGGAGKTRLALEVASHLERPPADGVWLVDLSSLPAGGRVASAVAAVLGVREEPGAALADTLADTLRQKQLLVVLDNCEHVLEQSAELLASLLTACPGVRVLATSREALSLPGEAVRPVPPLSTPSPGDGLEDIASAGAVALFCARAGLVRPDFRLGDDNAEVVVLICRRLDGIPLAIELAAARAGILSLSEIAALLDDRFSLLLGPGPPVPPRHQTLLAALEWSHGLLDPAEQAVLRRLAVFAGSATLGAVEEVCAGDGVAPDPVFDLVGRLVAKSFAVADTAGPQARYRLLETVRHYARDRLLEAGEADDVAERHASWCTGLAERSEPELTGADQQPWLDRLEADHDNLRTALEWTTGGGRAELAQRLAGSLSLFWRIRGHFSEGRSWVLRALQVPGPSPPAVRTRALWGAGMLTVMLGDYGDAVAGLQESSDLAKQLGDRRGEARASLYLGVCALFLEGPPVAIDRFHEAAGAAGEAGDRWCRSQALAMVGWAQIHQGEHAAARPYLEEAVLLARTGGDRQSAGIALSGLGEVALGEGNYAVAESVLEEALEVATQVGDTYGRGAALFWLGELALRRGDPDRAEALLGQALDLHGPTGAPDSTSDCLAALGEVAHARGDLDAAEERFGAAMGVLQHNGRVSAVALLGMAKVYRARGDLERASSSLTRALEITHAKGHSRGMASVLHELGHLAREEGDADTSASLHGRALDLRVQAGDLAGTAESLEAVALAAAPSRPAVAARVLAAVQRLREVNGYARPPGEARHWAAEVARLRQGLGVEAFRIAWQEGSALPVGKALALVVGP